MGKELPFTDSDPVKNSADDTAAHCSIETERASRLRGAKRWVVKVGSSLLTKEGKGLDFSFISKLVYEVIELRRRGIQCVLVSSGAVAAGMARLGLEVRPSELNLLQATAAVGQMGLTQAYEQVFRLSDVPTAQVLLTHDGFKNRERYLNARSTLKTLLDLGVVPIINENDAIANEEIRFGDNDSLSAMVVGLVDADLLVLVTDQKGLFDSNPDLNPDAKLIHLINASDETLEEFAGESGSAVGTGGMATKVMAARMASRAGVDTFIAGGNRSPLLLDILSEDPVGSLIMADIEPTNAKKQWLAIHLDLKAVLVLDDGAAFALQSQGKSLLAVGIQEVRGKFSRGDVVACLNTEGTMVANGLVNYSSDEVLGIKGKASQEIQTVLGYVSEPEVIHRDNMVLL